MYEIVTRTAQGVSTYSHLNAGVPWQDKMENHRNGLTSLPVYRLDLRDSKPLSECVDHAAMLSSLINRGFFQIIMPPQDGNLFRDLFTSL